MLYAASVFCTIGYEMSAKRLSAAERRDSLLEVAAALLREDGFDALTMEALVRRAGVSRGLGYVHFKNAHEVACALYERELTLIYERLVEATAHVDTLDASVRAALSTYFAYVEERGDVLSTLQSRMTGRDMQRPLEQKLAMLLGAWAQRLSTQLDIEHGAAVAMCGATLAVTDAYARSWRGGTISRAEAEDGCARFVLAGMRGAAAQR